MSTQLFGTDGIRGRVGKFPMLPDFAQRVGLATGSVLLSTAAQPHVVIGRDTRQSGQMLQHALTAGLLAGGATVLDAGVLPTPGVAFLVRKLGAQAGIVISASHNPVHENGIKLFNADGHKLPASIEREIEQRAQDPALFETRLSEQLGRSITAEALVESYITDLISEHPGLNLDKLTVVLDCANGAAYQAGPACFARLGARVIAINTAPTGLNINVRAGSEHARRYPAELGQLIRQHGADFGVAFDGDADRAVLIDSHDQIIDGDHILGILGEYLAARQQLAARTIVATSMRNAGLVNFMHAAQLQFIETQVGDKYVVEKLVELTQAAPHQIGLGGEQAGHIVLLDGQHTAGDGIRTALYMARVFVEAGAATVTDLARHIAKTPQIIASAHVNTKPPLHSIAALQALEQALAGQLPGLLKKELRYSGTESQFRVMLEADARHTEAELAQYARALCQAVQQAAGPADGFIEVLNCTRGGLL